MSMFALAISCLIRGLNIPGSYVILFFIALDFTFGGSKIIVGGDCSYEIKTHLLLGRKVMTNLDSILKAEALLCQQRSV